MYLPLKEMFHPSLYKSSNETTTDSSYLPSDANSQYAVRSA